MTRDKMTEDAIPVRNIGRPGAEQMRFDGKIVFLIGCQRSGTTWVQLLLFQHPAVASSQETHVFSNYLRHLEASWKREREGARPRRVGLSATLSQVEFDKLMCDYAGGVLAKIACGKAGTEVVVEKTPDHIHDWELILRIFPKAYFLHIIRDPRSVVCSLRVSGKSWGANWAPTNIIDAARQWISAVRAAREIRAATEHYMEITYEGLRSDGPHQLEEIFAWLGLDADFAFCKEAVAACSIDNLKNASKQVTAPWSLEEEPQDFYRQGAVEAWRAELSRGEVRVVEYLAGDLMGQLRYGRTTRPDGRKPMRLIWHQAVQRSLFLSFSAASAVAPQLLRRLRHVAEDAGDLWLRRR